jgi:hypothetical protein
MPVDPDWNGAGWMVIAAQEARHSRCRTPSCVPCGRGATSPGPKCASDRRGERLRRAALLAAGEQPVQALYRQFSAEAERLGVFGAPTFVIDDDGELFWGQDRLDFVDRKLDALRAQQGKVA